MESVSLSKIINDVRVILDQNRDDYTQLNVGEYTLELNEVIVKGVIPAAQWAHMNAPISKLKGVTFPDITTIGNVLQLPDDFMRLVSVRVSNWKRALNSYYAEDDPYVSQILSGYAGLMPTYNKPAMVCVRRTTGISCSIPMLMTSPAIPMKARLQRMIMLNMHITYLYRKLKDWMRAVMMSQVMTTLMTMLR